MRFLKVGFFLLTLMFLTVQVIAANEITVEGDGDPSYIIFVGGASQGISAFGVEIQYSSDVNITAVESVEPFEVVSGVDAINRSIKVGGYLPHDSQTTINGPIRLAKIWSSGAIEGVVTVDYLEDCQKNPIPVSNQADISLTQTKTLVPVYEPPPTYSSPGTVQVNPTLTDSTNVPKTAATPLPQASVSWTPSTTDTTRDEVESQTVPPTSTDIAPLTGSLEADTIEPTTPKTSLMLCTPFGAIFSVLLLMRRKQLINR